jgi:hypothetical protein
MGNSKHIFLQLNTDEIISQIKLNPNQDLNQLAIENSLLFDQGSMVLGDPIKSFVIDVAGSQEIFFTVLPMNLFSKDKLYFHQVAFTPSGNNTIPIKLENPLSHAISFKISIGKDAKTGSIENFSLNIMLEPKPGSYVTPLSISIDPVIQVRQS